MPKFLALSIVLLLANLAGCALTPKLQPIDVPKSLGEVNSGYTYVPIDPFPVQSAPGDGCTGAAPYTYLGLPDALPDNAVRMLIETLSESGNISYLVSKAAAQNQRYRVTVDYINADTINVPIWLSLTMVDATGSLQYVDPVSPPGIQMKTGSEVYDIRTSPPTSADMAAEPGLKPYNIPIYVGIGLRVSANVYTVGANVNISGIGVIGAEADAQHLTGSLVVQTLGVNGKSVEAALPIQSDLNRTTAENAIVAVGTIKALLYADDTEKKERIVGLYLPFSGGQALVNALISALSKAPVQWKRPCVVPSANKPATPTAVTKPQGKALAVTPPASTSPASLAPASPTSPTSVAPKPPTTKPPEPTAAAKERAAKPPAKPDKTHDNN